MGSTFLDEYKTVFNSALNGLSYKRKFSSIKEVENLRDNFLELVIKHYPQSETGISHQVHTSAGANQFYIHGPLGKGLEFDRFNSSGINLIFVGGTGILPFMDLFAYLARKLLKENDPDYAIFPDENFEDLSDAAVFEVFAYFPTREEAVGIEFIESLEKLHLKFSKGGNFKLNLILTKRDGHRHSNEELIELICEFKKIHTRINKLWVCGPPPMNYQFERLMPTIIEKTELGFDDFAIM